MIQVSPLLLLSATREGREIAGNFGNRGNFGGVRICHSSPGQASPLVMSDCGVVSEDRQHTRRATRDLARTRAPRFPAITTGPSPSAQRMLGLPAVRRRPGYPGRARRCSISQPTKAGAVKSGGTRARPPGRRVLLLQLAVAALCVVCAGATLTGFARFASACRPPGSRARAC